ncbi:hypothetical protein IWX75_002536 [Arthrobacter sp. CAN_A6]
MAHEELAECLGRPEETEQCGAARGVSRDEGHRFRVGGQQPDAGLQGEVRTGGGPQGVEQDYLVDPVEFRGGEEAPALLEVREPRADQFPVGARSTGSLGACR